MKNSYDVVGIGGLIIVYDYVKKLIQLIKKYHPAAKIIIGDSLGSSVPDLVLKDIGADFICIGEGEKVIIDLLNNIESKGNLSNVKGIAFLENDKVIINPQIDVEQNLDIYGMPEIERFPIDLYLSQPVYAYAKRYDTPLPLPARQHIITAHRGCPYQCNFCYQIFGRKIRYRSVNNIIEEVIYMHSKHNVQFVTFGIDLFIANKDFIYKFCDAYIKEGLDKKVKWGTPGRANLITKDLVTRLKSAGCIQLAYGFESASPKILETIKKNISPEQIENTIKLTRESGINMTYSFMIGQPGETKKTIEESVNFIKKNNLYVHRFFFATPYPGTDLYEYAEKKELIKNKLSFIKELQSATKFIVNLTDLTNDELLNLYKTATHEVRNHYKHKFPSVYIKKKLKQFFLLNKTNNNNLNKMRMEYAPEWQC